MSLREFAFPINEEITAIELMNGSILFRSTKVDIKYEKPDEVEDYFFRIYEKDTLSAVVCEVDVIAVYFNGFEQRIDRRIR